MRQIILALMLTVVATGFVRADDNIATARDAALDVEVAPPRMARVENSEIKRRRSYPMQPPTIPHKIDNYQVDINVNKCMSCHSRKQSQDSQAPMISVTHYMDREANFLADISPRRYFCLQCHVSQYDIAPKVGNTFVDIDELLRGQQP